MTTLGYIDTSKPNYAGILHTSVLKGSTLNKNNPVLLKIEKLELLLKKILMIIMFILKDIVIRRNIFITNKKRSIKQTK
jgi:hypothetical protein